MTVGILPHEPRRGEREPGPGNVVALAAPERRRDPPHDEPRPERDRGRGRHGDEVPAAPAAPVVGLGDHVPAFLLRTVKLPKTA